jgi:hypothetical protein
LNLGQNISYSKNKILHVKYPLFFSDFNKTSIFSTHFRKRLTSPVAAELFHGDGRTDRHDEVNSRISQFYEGA